MSKRQRDCEETLPASKKRRLSTSNTSVSTSNETKASGTQPQSNPNDDTIGAFLIKIKLQRFVFKLKEQGAEDLSDLRNLDSKEISELADIVGMKMIHKKKFIRACNNLRDGWKFKKLFEGYSSITSAAQVCGWARHAPCPKCTGRGWMNEGTNHLAFCKECNNKGYVAMCAKCKGRGFVHQNNISHVLEPTRPCEFCQSCEECKGVTYVKAP